MASHDQKRQDGKVGLDLIYLHQSVEDFKFWVNVAGRPHQIPSKENLDDVVREACEELPTYRDILEISDRVKKSEPKKEFTKEKKDYAQSVSSFKKKVEAHSSTGASFNGYKKPGSFSVEKDMKDVECFKCHKKGR